MKSIARPFTRQARQAVAAVATALLVLSMAPASAQASPETLQRSMGNLLQSPLDVVLAPVVAFRTLFTNLRDVDDGAERVPRAFLNGE